MVENSQNHFKNEAFSIQTLNMASDKTKSISRKKILADPDPTAAERKKNHIELAFESQVAAMDLDARFFYEPMLAAHPQPGSLPKISFGKKEMRTPIWVSSMTGGTGRARKINENLARACGEFGLGMGLGSCRQLLFSDEFLPDFDVRQFLGDSAPLFANLGVAQIEAILQKKETARLTDLVSKLRADGLIIHVNPMQEAMQPEGDRFICPPLETIQKLLAETSIPLIVKEVGQGFGPASLRELLKLPLVAVEFAAAGGTNFARLELLRNSPVEQIVFEKIATVGHTAEQMLDWANHLSASLGADCRTENLIISGGVKSFLDGFYLTKKSRLSAVYGQASGFLKYAQGDYSELKTFVAAQIRGLELANAFLKVV